MLFHSGIRLLCYNTNFHLMVLSQVFICFLAMVILGCAAGLVLLPVLLSLTGPVGNIQHDGNGSEVDDDDERADHKQGKENSEYGEEVAV